MSMLLLLRQIKNPNSQSLQFLPRYIIYSSKCFFFFFFQFKILPTSLIFFLWTVFITLTRVKGKQKSNCIENFKQKKKMKQNIFMF